MVKWDLIKDWNAPKSARAAQTYLGNKHNLLKALGSVEEFAVDEDVLDPKDKRAIEHHLINLRAALARYLWRKEIYIGISILDTLIFDALQSNAADYAIETLDRLSKASVSAGYIIYPLHSTGIVQSPSFWAKGSPSPVVFKQAGFAIVAQCHDFASAERVLKTAMKALGIHGKTDLGAFQHQMTNGPMKWFTRNPMLVVKIATLTGTYYENQFIYTLKLRLTNALMMMLASFNGMGAMRNDLNTTRRVNNWQTLDIHHYLVGEAIRNKKSATSVTIDTRRIPMNSSAVDLAHLSDVPIDIDPSMLNKKESQKRLMWIAQTISAVERGTWQYVTLARDKKTPNGRVFSKVLLSLDWYRRSFSATARDSESVVALATAFETLLSDFYVPGITTKIINRVTECVKGNRSATAYVTAVGMLFNMRGKALHLGAFQGVANLTLARRAYALCLRKIVRGLPIAAKNTNEPIKLLLGI